MSRRASHVSVRQVLQVPMRRGQRVLPQEPLLPVQVQQRVQVLQQARRPVPELQQVPEPRRVPVQVQQQVLQPVRALQREPELQPALPVLLRQVQPQRVRLRGQLPQERLLPIRHRSLPERFPPRPSRLPARGSLR
jgi:hypothetical protein